MIAFEIIEIENLAQRMADDDFHVLKIAKSFPLEETVKKVRDISSQYQLISKDNYQGYKAIGLQYDDEENPLYDVVNMISYISEQRGRIALRKLGGNYLKRNEIGNKFEDFFEYFQQFVYLIRGRIIKAEPGCRIREHTDGMCCAALHYVVETNPQAVIIIEDKEYHLPKDGHFYLINASRRHYIKNLGTQDRTHIIFPLNPACFKELKKSQLEKMNSYFKQMDIDINRFKHLKITE